MASIELSAAASPKDHPFRPMTPTPPTTAAAPWYQQPSARIVAGVVFGFGLGIVLGRNDASPALVSWVALPGTLFLRALTCIVVPLVFVNIFLSVVEMRGVSSAGLHAIGLFVGTTVVAVGFGTLAVLLLQSHFAVASSSAEMAAKTSTDVQLGCGDTRHLVVALNGAVVCAATANSSSLLHLVNATAPAAVSLTQTIQDQIFKAMVPDNIVLQFVSGNYLGILAFAIFLALAMQRSERDCPTLVALCEDINAVLLAGIEAVITCTPYAVASLIAGGLGMTNDFSAVFGNVGLFLVAFLLAALAQVGALSLLLYVVVCRRLKRPLLPMLKAFVPAQMFAFGCASSAATIPITLQTATATGASPSIAGFVVTLGATLHMNGTALYFPCAVVYVVVSSGGHLSPVTYLVLCILSLVSAAATAPVPSGALVMVLPMVVTVGGDSAAASFSYLLAMDFCVDRIRTMVNVYGDLVVAHCVAALNPTHASSVNFPESTDGSASDHV
ncbi:hypothetical protein SDRG_08518 [Saprolegnia diclina VS20]|uniref:Amino acid transporter n=1 Tax=Saprolegnia diclina (strain VS20) TaxID=1156394 RepID=T0RTX8_SAPDV|nr:hypothetical protein SDRG_08518 [Saprolegnia diclina VS20]EQC33837.1 hypothetical protein SDRG_08518 [Saprolegnia diclina VS20]|eukprot:XP_008612632.1 hypothetical protein SDRG_08518 [Saprolegnia diclina VS20]